LQRGAQLGGELIDRELDVEGDAAVRVIVYGGHFVSADRPVDAARFASASINWPARAEPAWIAEVSTRSASRRAARSAPMRATAVEAAVGSGTPCPRAIKTLRA
jgi:hypothetical protein